MRLMTSPLEAGLALRQRLEGMRVAAVLCAAAELRLSDLLAQRPQTAAELAEATSAHAPTLQRLLRALEALQIFERDAEGRYSNTVLGAALQTGAPGGAAEWARYVGRPHYWHTWTGLPETIRTGENTFTATNGMSVWEWRAQRPDEREVFDNAMTGLTRAVIDGVVSSYDFSAFGTVADIGGGNGGLLASILAANPSVRGVLFDQPDAVAAASPLLTAAGVANRCELVGGSFFDGVPAGADAYVLKSIIHDWDDESSGAILRRCREAADDAATLLLVEQLVDQAPDRVRTALSDINMLVMPGGQERTTNEYAALLAAAGWRLTRTVSTATDSFVIEAAAA